MKIRHDYLKQEYYTITTPIRPDTYCSIQMLSAIEMLLLAKHHLSILNDGINHK